MKEIFIESIEYIGDEEQQCITIESIEGLYITDDGIITHNSMLTGLANLFTSVHLGLMYKPYTFFGGSPSSIYTQVLGSVSQKLGSSLLMEPIVNILENSEFFVRLRTHEKLLEMDKELSKAEKLEHLYWTRATPSSTMQLSNGVNYKLIASATSLLGQAQPLDAKIYLPNGSYKLLNDVHVGDVIASPIFQKTTVLAEFPQGEIDCYEIELNDGRKTQCSLNHLWCVAWERDKENNWIWEIVNTEFILNHSEIEFEIFDNNTI